jgi:hypothetical protein
MKNQGGFYEGFLGVFSQHFAGNHAQGLDYNVYQITPTDFQFLFNRAYVSSLMNLKQITVSVNDNQKPYAGIAKILEAYQLGYLTSVFGDIPWSQALDVIAFPNPKYDSQIDIYTTIQKLIADGIVLIDAGGDPVSGDLIYNGDLDKWKAAAYLLSARYYNHFSKADPLGSATNVLNMIDKAKNAGFSSSTSNFALPYDGTTGETTNPWVEMADNGMCVVNKVFLDKMIAENDPRINAYFTSTNKDGDNVYGLGKIISGNPGDGKYMGIGYDSYSYFGKSTSNVLLATYSELLMLEAEAAFRSNDLPRAATAHNAAIASQMNDVVTLTADKAKIPAYISTYASETAATITLEKIMTEKYKLMVTLEAESWMDVRRCDYKYPSWLAIPVVDETTVPVVPAASAFIQRLPYPQSELDKNAGAVPRATIFDKLPILK